MEYTERRRHVRHKIKAAAVITSEQGDLPCQINNISVDGVGIKAASAVVPGSKISIRLNQGDNILFRGTVIWARFMADKTDQFYEMGVKTSAVILNRKAAETTKQKSELLQEILQLLNR